MKNEQFARGCARFAQRFVVIYGFTMLATLVFMLLFNRESSVDWHYFLWCVVFSLAGDAPSFVFVADHELTEREWRQRMLLSTALTVGILLPLGHGWMWTGWGGGILFFLAILVVTFGVHAIGFGVDTHTANQLNEQIRKRRQAQNTPPIP